MWLTFLAVVVVSFATLIFMRPVAEKVGLIDKPNFRKRHQGFIPLIGGIALVLLLFMHSKPTRFHCLDFTCFL